MALLHSYLYSYINTHVTLFPTSNVMCVLSYDHSRIQKVCAYVGTGAYVCMYINVLKNSTNKVAHNRKWRTELQKENRSHLYGDTS